MRILLTGASGLLGKKVFNYLTKEGFDVIALYHKDVDITDYEKLKLFFYKHKPDVVLHLAALTKVDYCEINKEECFNVNIVGTDFVEDLCYELKCKLFFISTDYVFDGKKGDYKENDERNPINYYGFSKMVGEDLTMKLPSYVILRTSLLYGYNDKADKVDFVRFVVDNLRKGKIVNAATDLITKPTLIDDVAVAVKKLLDKNAVGIFHCSGSEEISRYDFALKIADFFGLKKELVRPVLSSQLKLKADRPKNSTLDNSKIRKFGVFSSKVMQGLRIAGYKF